MTSAFGCGFGSSFLGVKSILPTIFGKTIFGRSIKSGNGVFSAATTGFSSVGLPEIDPIVTVLRSAGGAVTEGVVGRDCGVDCIGRTPKAIWSAFSLSAFESENFLFRASYIESVTFEIGRFSISKPFPDKNSTTVPMPTFSSLATLISCLSIQVF